VFFWFYASLPRSWSAIRKKYIRHLISASRTPLLHLALSASVAYNTHGSAFAMFRRVCTAEQPRLEIHPDMTPYTMLRLMNHHDGIPDINQQLSQYRQSESFQVIMPYVL
jgi:hypothetical protein